MSMGVPTLSADGPVLLFGGPYGNRQATEAVLAAGRDLGIPLSHTICTGDLVAYCGDPVATIALVREAGVAVIVGNCDEQLAAGAEDCGCGFEDGSACDRLSAAWYTRVDAAVSAADRAWLGKLPRSLDIAIAGRRLRVLHGGVGVINQFVFATTPVDEKRRQLGAVAAEGCDGIVGGHCGLPFTQVIDGRLWHNAGVVGMPANDGTPRVWFSVLTPRGGGIEIAHHALDYDHRGAMAAMLRHGYPNEYREALASGIWPSSDVLPGHERMAQGHALRAATLLWHGGDRNHGLGTHWPEWPVPVCGPAAAECA